MNPTAPIPVWVKIIIIAAMLPLLAFPTLLDQCPPDSPLHAFVWFYPAYVIASGVCAWMCYPQRPALSWILIVLMLLSHASIFWGVFQ